MTARNLLCALTLFSAGCPAGNQNPQELWLAPNGSELMLKLSDQEPEPF